MHTTTYNGFKINQSNKGFSVTLPNTGKISRYPYDLIESTDYMYLVSVIDNWIESNF